jgi:uncharacterized protein YybS (DUF2232 family)
VNRRRIIIITAVLLSVTLPYWSALPLLVDFLPAQAMFGALAYLLEVLLMVVMVMAVVEGRIRLMVVAAVLGFILGAAPGLALIPLAIFLPFCLKAIVPAMIMGLLINRGWRAGKSFVAASLLMAVFVLMIFAQSGQGLSGQAEELYASIENMVAGPMAARGYDAEAINNLVDQLMFFMTLVTRLLPGMIIMSGVGQLFIAFLLTDWYYTRRDSYFPGFGPFIYWKIPEKLLYLLGVTLVIRLTIDGSMEIVADNVIFILFTSYAVCGLALIEHFLRRLRLPVLIRAVFYIGLGFMHIPGLMATSIAGLFDSYFDFRKVRAHTLG